MLMESNYWVKEKNETNIDAELIILPIKKDYQSSFHPVLVKSSKKEKEWLTLDCT